MLTIKPFIMCLSSVFHVFFTCFSRVCHVSVTCLSRVCHVSVTCLSRFCHVLKYLRTRNDSLSFLPGYVPIVFENRCVDFVTPHVLRTAEAGVSPLVFVSYTPTFRKAPDLR